MQYFDFSYLLNKYKSQITAITLLEGYYDENGDWVKGENAETIIDGAVINFKESKIYRSEGKLTANDKRLFTSKPLDSALYGSKILYEGKVYSIEDSTENAKFTGVYAYTLKYVSAFKENRIDLDITETVEDLEERLDGVLLSEEPPEETEVNYRSALEKRLDGVAYD